MSFLPIVERELRVASRKKFTYWGRLAAAGFALVIFGLLLGVAMAARGAIPAGQIEFTVLKWMTFVFACCAGVFFTSDSISEEKREGTLGLLFLTDLRGYDVVFGKLLSQSLRAFYGMLAAFPILALPLLLGGVTGGEFALSMLVIANTLFFSLAVGLFTSTVSRDYTKAMSGTFLVCLLFFLGLAFADSAIAASRHRTFQPVFSLANPAWLFSVTHAYLPAGYWKAFGIQHGLAWGFLLAASLLAPRTWQEKSGNSGGSVSSFPRRWRFGGARFRAALRRRWLENWPVHWLAMRDRWLPRLMFGLAALLLLVEGANLVVSLWEYHQQVQLLRTVPILRFLTGALRTLVELWLVLCLAAQSSRFFVDANRTGALELLLVTPVGPREIVRGQWSALCRTFLLPVLCVFLLDVTGQILDLAQTKKTLPNNAVTVTTISSNTSSGSTTVNISTNTLPYPSVPGMTMITSSNYSQFKLYSLICASMEAVVSVVDLAALAWFGMWMGLTNRKSVVAVLKVICFVIVLPEIAFGVLDFFMYFLLIPAKASLAATFFVPAVAGSIFRLVKDAFFIIWSRQRLFGRFRATVAQEGKYRRRAYPPAPPPIPGRPFNGATTA